MAILVTMMRYTEVIMVLVFVLFLLHFLRSKGHPWNWPLIGMLPIWFPIFNHIFESLTHILECTKGTFVYKGPWSCNRDMIVTCDPANVHHILSSNFSNYPKGSDTKLLFEPYGQFLFSQDFDEWRNHRKITHGFLNDQAMHRITSKVNLEIFEKQLIPVLDNACEQGIALDLQDIIRRFMLDATVLVVTGCNHGSLCIEFTEDPVLKAMHDINQGMLMRHILPEMFWKLQSWLGLGHEKKILEAQKLVDGFITKYIQKRNEYLMNISNDCDEEAFCAIKYFTFPIEMMVDFIKASIFAATDPTSSALTWFFSLVLENPVVEIKIREEIEANLSSNKFAKRLIFHPEELNKLVFLHAALLESIRLYPSAPFQSRTCIQPDILPTGHHVRSGMRVVISSYAMGRMKSAWGEDCHQFKPERWISDKGRIITVASNKFAAFSSGPRLCLGKELSLVRLKAVAATIIHNYDIQLVKNHPVTPATAIILNMEYGLKATITKRSA